MCPSYHIEPTLCARRSAAAAFCHRRRSSTACSFEHSLHIRHQWRSHLFGVCFFCSILTTDMSSCSNIVYFIRTILFVYMYMSWSKIEGYISTGKHHFLLLRYEKPLLRKKNSTNTFTDRLKVRSGMETSQHHTTMEKFVRASCLIFFVSPLLVFAAGRPGNWPVDRRRKFGEHFADSDVTVALLGGIAMRLCGAGRRLFALLANKAPPRAN